MMRCAAWLVLFATLGQPACHTERALEPQNLPADSDIAVDFRTDKTQYRIGESARTVMVNHSPNTITMGVCNDVLELQVTGGWHEIAPGAVACIALALIVAPGDSVSLALDLKKANTPGTYRVRRFFSVAQGGTASTMYRRTNTFTMVR
jgi:hypothetical protein